MSMESEFIFMSSHFVEMFKEAGDDFDMIIQHMPNMDNVLFFKSFVLKDSVFMFYVEIYNILIWRINILTKS